ncbi:MAG: serine/threonine-protein kinase PknK, partial [Cyanobacteria bacterium P01_D01_bin.44]
MLTIAGYEVTELIYSGARSLIYRGIRQADGRSVVLKTLAAPYPTLGAIANLKYEYEILNTLDIPDIIKPVEWKAPTASPILVLEDFQGISLRGWIQQQGALSLQQFLPLALKLTHTLGQLHQAQLIHRDIKPSNILINPTTEDIKLIDFGLATQLAQTAQVSSNQPNNRAVAGTYAYMSPEQTGRMNRTVDYRTDLYSLGVTFYEMLTGQLPFQASDPMAWVHCHIAKAPTPLQEVNPAIPEVVSQIVTKLLSKMAEDRYQQAQGLSADLQICLDQLNTAGTIAPFAMGGHDRSGQFQLPQILYGRATEILTLLGTFDRISQGAVELTLVSGYSGIGKSALVHEIHKPVVRQRGYFITGKFDQFRRNVPYESLIQAFQDLVRQLLSENETELGQWQQQLQTSLGTNGQVLIDVIPELELIIGPQPTIPDVTPAEAQARFNQTFQKLVRVFAQPEHPLVVFLDDLQWVDSASLDLVTQLLIDTESGHLLIIGAYRDNEVGPDHPLLLTLDQLKAQVTLNQIALQPLQLSHVQQLVADTLNTDVEAVQELGSLLFEKTLGNAFFTRMLFKSLYSEGQLTFDFTQATWQWDITQLQVISLTDNVVALMMSRIHHLPEATQQVLTLAACIGDQFDLSVLSIVSEHAPATVAQLLWPALTAGLIMPLGENYRIPMLLESESLVSDVVEQICYRFVHDRIQEAAYGLLHSAQRDQTHWRIGNLLLQQWGDLDLDETVFGIVNHLNRGKALVSNEPERYQLAELNWQAGCKAKGASAYETALKYFDAGLSLLPETAWQSHYGLAFSLHRDDSECEYLCGNFERAEHLFELTLNQATSVIDQATIHIIRLVLYDNQGKFVENLSVGGEALRSLGLRWPQSPDETASVLEAELDIYRHHCQDCQIPQLVYKPEMSDAIALACMQLLVNMTGPAYFTDPTLVTLVTLKMANLSMQYGNSQWASQGYTFWGAMLSAAFRDYETAYTFGQVALQLKERYNNYNEAKVLNSYVGFISHWRSHFKVGIALLRRAYRVGVETGDVFTGYIVTHLGLHLILMGAELGEIQTELARYLAYLRKTQNDVFARQIQIYLYISAALQTGVFTSEGANLEDFDESACIHLFQTNQYGPGLVSLFVFKAMHAWLFGQYDEALRFVRQSEATIAFVAGMPGEAEHTFYHALILAALYETAAPETQLAYEKTLQACAEKLRGWADNCEANYLHRYLLISAERSRLSGDISNAIDCYDQAIASAQAYEFVQNEAIANELAAQFWLARGKA